MSDSGDVAVLFESMCKQQTSSAFSRHFFLAFDMQLCISILSNCFALLYTHLVQAFWDWIDIFRFLRLWGSRLWAFVKIAPYLNLLPHFGLPLSLQLFEPPLGLGNQLLAGPAELLQGVDLEIYQVLIFAERWQMRRGHGETGECESTITRKQHNLMIWSSRAYTSSRFSEHWETGQNWESQMIIIMKSRYDKINKISIETNLFFLRLAQPGLSQFIECCGICWFREEIFSRLTRI